VAELILTFTKTYNSLLQIDSATFLPDIVEIYQHLTYIVIVKTMRVNFS